jgi:hypothetical protein
LGRGLVEIHGDDLCTVRGQRPSGLPADSAAAADDDGSAAVEPEKIRVVQCPSSVVPVMRAG